MTDIDEINTYKTDPTNIDTDGDTVTDGDEITAGMDPLVPDQAVATGSVLVPIDEEQRQNQLMFITILLVGIAMGIAVSLLQGREKKK